MGFGYYVTGRTTSVTRGIVTLIMGCCLLFWPGFTAGLIVKLIAGFLLTIGFITLFTAIMAASKSNSPLPVIVIINVVVYLVFGLLVFLFPNFFLGLIAFLFGAVLLIAGISQIIGLYQGPQRFPPRRERESSRRHSWMKRTCCRKALAQNPPPKARRAA